MTAHTFHPVWSNRPSSFFFTNFVGIISTHTQVAIRSESSSIRSVFLAINLPKVVCVLFLLLLLSLWYDGPSWRDIGRTIPPWFRVFGGLSLHLLNCNVYYRIGRTDGRKRRRRSGYRRKYRPRFGSFGGGSRVGTAMRWKKVPLPPNASTSKREKAAALQPPCQHFLVERVDTGGSHVFSSSSSFPFLSFSFSFCLLLWSLAREGP